MVAFTGRPLSSVPRGRHAAKVTFEITERLWGVAGLDSIMVETIGLRAPDPQRSWFVVARRRTASSGAEEYLVDHACCLYGLLLPSDHAWAMEFRHNVARRKAADMRVVIRSNFIPLPNIRMRLDGPGYSWQGSSEASGRNLDLPSGEYIAEIEQSLFALPEAGRRVSILPGACATWSLDVEPSSSISGRIVDEGSASGQKLHYLLSGEVDASGWESPLASLRRAWHRVAGWGGPPVQRTHYVLNPDSEGRFRKNVLPGKYRLSVMSLDSHSYIFPPPIPKVYYPGVIEIARAEEIVVPPGHEVDHLDFRIPDNGPVRRVDVALVRADGSPAANIVVAHTGRYPGERYRTAGWTQKLTDAQGRATFDLWQSLDYDLHIDGVVSGDTLRISAGSAPVTRRFTVRPFGQR